MISTVEAKDSHIHERNTKGCQLPDSYEALTYTLHYIMLLLIPRVDDRRVSNCTIIAAETALTVSKSQTVLLSVHFNHHFLCKVLL